MIFWQLFWTFLKVGAFSFGGGYGMIAMIREEMLANAWISEEQLLNMIAVSESTPGPIAVNMATFVGVSKAGIFGAIVATLGVVLPSFCIILLIAAIMQKLMKYKSVNAFLAGIRPTIIALILATAIALFLSNFIGFDRIGSALSIDWRACILFCILCGVAFGYGKIRHKKISAIGMIFLSSLLGILFYAF